MTTNLVEEQRHYDFSRICMEDDDFFVPIRPTKQVVELRVSVNRRFCGFAQLMWKGTYNHVFVVGFNGVFPSYTVTDTEDMVLAIEKEINEAAENLLPMNYNVGDNSELFCLHRTEGKMDIKGRKIHWSIAKRLQY